MTERHPVLDKIVVGMAGRCFAEKGFDIFLHAIAQIEPPENVEILIWGVPPLDDCDQYGQQLWSQIERLPDPLRTRIRVEPFKVNVDDFYRAVDVVVVPSRFEEPFGRVADRGHGMATCGHRRSSWRFDRNR